MRPTMIILSLLALNVIAARPLQDTVPGMEWLSSLGVNAIAGLVLVWKRQDDTKHAAELAAKNDQYAKSLELHVGQLAKVNDRVLDVVSANTKVLTEVVSAFNYQAQQRRRTDIQGIDTTEAHS